MELLIAMAVLAVVTVVPVMVAAKMLGASNTGFLSCLFAVIISAFASSYAEGYFDDGILTFVVPWAVTAVVYALILGAGFIQSAFIALLATAIQIGGLIVLAGFL